MVLLLQPEMTKLDLNKSCNITANCFFESHYICDIHNNFNRPIALAEQNDFEQKLKTFCNLISDVLESINLQSHNKILFKSIIIAHKVYTFHTNNINRK